MPQHVEIPGMGVVEFPDGMNDEQIASAIKQNLPSGNKTWGDSAKDFVKSIPGGVLGGLSNTLSAGGQAAQAEMGQPIDAPGGPETQKILEKNVTGELPVPQGRSGKFGRAIGEGLGTPTTYLGPGSMALKLGGSVLSSAGGEAGGQLAEGTKYEIPARLAGSMAGGVLASKMLGPTAPTAETPTAQELKDAAVRGGKYGGYEAARNSGLELHPQAMPAFGKYVENDLGQRFTGGQYGTAPKTMAVLNAIQNPPAGSKFTANNLDTLRRNLGDIAQEVQPAMGGFARPTTDAAAASQALERLNKYVESIPQNHVMAGNASDYVNAVKEANGNYAAAQRLGNVDARLGKAANAVDRQIAGSLDNQIKSKVGGMLDNPERLRGLTDAEKAQLELINKGTLTSNVLRQAGRAGTGVVPFGIHAAIAGASGGATVGPQAAIAAALYGAKKTAEHMTVSRANKLAEMLAQRSPLYEARVNALPQVDLNANKAAIARALMNGLQQQ